MELEKCVVYLLKSSGIVCSTGNEVRVGSFMVGWNCNWQKRGSISQIDQVVLKSDDGQSLMLVEAAW